MQEKEIQSLNLQNLSEGPTPPLEKEVLPPSKLPTSYSSIPILKLLRVSLIVTCECTPEVLIEPLGVAEFGGDPIESLRGGLDFE